MADSMETESQLSLSEDEPETEEQSPSKDKDDKSMDVDIDLDDSETQDDEDKENTNKPKARKRKSPDSSSSNARKKRKTDNVSHKLKIKIASDELHFEVKTLQKLPFLKNKIIKNDDDTFKFKSSSNNTFKSSERFNMEDFENMIKYIEDDSIDHINDIERLEGFVYCSDKFKIELEIETIETCYNDCDDLNEFEIDEWKSVKSKVLKDLYKTIKSKENDTTSRRAKAKTKKRSVVPNDDDDDGDTEMKTKGDKKEKKKKKKKKLSKVVRQLNDIPDYLRLSEDEEEEQQNKKEKSRRLQQRKQAIMTQEAMDDSKSDDEEDEEDEEDDKRKQRKLNDEERDIKRLDDVKLEEIGLLQSMTIRRLCRNHQIAIHKTLSKADKKRKKETEEKNKKFVYCYIDDAKLIKKLKDKKKRMDKELKIASLKDIGYAQDIGNLGRATIKRLCKVHHIKANQKIQSMIKCLEDQYENPVDDDAFIESLKDVSIEDIEDLSREILIKLCNVHGIETTKEKKKKTKKKKKKGKDDSDYSDEDEEDDLIDLSSDELISALSSVKEIMNEKKLKRQKGKIEKLEQIQQDIVHIGFRENFLTISGSNTSTPKQRRKRSRNGVNKDKIPFKEDVMGLVALCNSEVTKKGNGYSVNDNPLSAYKVVVSEEGARTIKVMMVIARGGSVVSKKWVNHSIKEKRWLPPQNYEDRFPHWMNAAMRARDSRIKRKKVKHSDDEEDEIDGPLFAGFSIYVQDRKDITNPSALVIQHLARCAGAHIVDKKWKTQKRLKRKQVDDDGNEDNDRNRNKKNDKKEEDDDDDEEDEEEEEEEEENKKKKKRKLSSNEKVIISHSAIYKDLKIKKGSDIHIVTANWLFDCIENYKIVPFHSKYIVKPNRQQSLSPVH